MRKFVEYDIDRRMTMSDKSLNAYRFSPENEPTYEMLSAIMKEVAAEAKDNGKRASDAYFNAMLRDIDRKQAKWATRIKRIVDGRKN